MEHFLVFFRGNSRGDLCHRVGVGDNGQIHLQEDRNLSEPGRERIPG